MLQYLERIDHSLFFLINAGLGGLDWKWLDQIFLDLTSLGSWTIALIAVALLVNETRKHFLRHLLVILVALAVLAPINGMIKNGVGRERPAKKFREQLEEGKVSARFIEPEVARHHSFPSGHTGLSFLLMTYAGLVRRPLLPWSLSLAGLIGFSRVYVGAHFPSDCLAGALLGLLGGWMAWRAFAKLSGPGGETAR